MNGQFLIPANSKKGLLFFGWFYTSDLILLCTGITITIILMMSLPISEITYAVISLLPALICVSLVMPVPNYHNVRTLIKEAWNFYTTRQKYIWKGWCFTDGETSKK